ncbi:MAG: hypothetical protein IJM37_10535 [Lachnospiraceae bacterium]|nr:hypothetical protein [Lachnospiraceae bacterium]
MLFKHEFTFESPKHKDEVRDIILIKDIEISAFKYMKAHSSNETCDTIVLKPKTEMSLYYNSFIPTAKVDIFEVDEGSRINVNCSPLKGVKVVGLMLLLMPFVIVFLGIFTSLLKGVFADGLNIITIIINLSISFSDFLWLLFFLILAVLVALFICSLVFKMYAGKLFRKIIKMIDETDETRGLSFASIKKR